MKGEKEKMRLLRLLAKEKAELEWPCSNRDLLDLVETGHAARTRNYTAHWGGRAHSMSTISITGRGRAKLTEPASSLDQTAAGLEAAGTAETSSLPPSNPQ
jgi:hypothetical protein